MFHACRHRKQMPLREASTIKCRCLLTCTVMNSNTANSTYAMSSTQTTVDPDRPPQYTNAVPLTLQAGSPQQWGPTLPQNFHPLIVLAAQVHNNAWSQGMHPSISQNDGHNQSAVPAFNAYASMLSTMTMQGSSPVGSLPGDDFFLAQALHRSTDMGQTYKQAIESLHGVSQIPYCSLHSWRPYNVVNEPPGQ